MSTAEYQLYLALRQLELALSMGGNLEFLRDVGVGSALTFAIELRDNIDAMEVYIAKIKP